MLSAIRRTVSSVPQDDPRLGQVLRGKYRLERVLGTGGMATVYAATHRNRRKFALKLLHPELSAQAEIRARFQREGYVANSVGHRGAVAVLDDDVAEDGSAFLVMELLEGMTVEALWEKNGQTLPVPVALALADQLLDILHAAHESGIIHRDLKPANLFLTRDGSLKVLDFGIARLRDSTSIGMTQTGTTMGTPGFMSPEQARGTQSELDPQADLWAVAATLFTLLSGQLVHEGESAQMLVVNLLTQPARSILTVAPELPQAIADVIDHGLLFDKSQRFASAAQMRDALTRAERAVYGALAPDAGHKALAALLKTQSDALGPLVESQVTLPSTARRRLSLATALIAGLSLVAIAGGALLFGARSSLLAAGRPSAPGAPPQLPEQTEPPPGSAGPRADPTMRADAAGLVAAPRSPASSAGIDPRAAPPRRAASAGPPPPAASSSKACANLLQRQGLGELLTPQENAFFGQHCGKSK
jgi:eukaryotic-like serine/threonine-protein kinase